MSGNTKETELWTGADVFIAPLGTAGPTDLTTAWAAAWKPVGLMDGSDGLTESRDQTTSEAYAWGGILFRRTVSKQKRSIAFSALEDNATVFSLANPGSTESVAAGVRTRQHIVPVAGTQFALGVELRDGDRVKRWIVPTCEVDKVDDIKDSETDPTVFKFTVTIFPDSTGLLYTTLETDPNGTGA